MQLGDFLINEQAASTIREKKAIPTNYVHQL
jgi:hypothetical protein